MTYVMIFVSHSCTRRTLSVCAFHEAIGRSVRVDVMMTVPEISPEQRRSLSDENSTVFMFAACTRRTCDGDGGGSLVELECMIPGNIDDSGDSASFPP